MDYFLVVSGSLLFFFSIFINDLRRNIRPNIKFFANDTMLFSIVNDQGLCGNDTKHNNTMCIQ